VSVRLVVATDQSRMRVVIEEDSFREDKERLRYSPEQLDEMLCGA